MREKSCDRANQSFSHHTLSFLESSINAGINVHHKSRIARLFQIHRTKHKNHMLAKLGSRYFASCEESLPQTLLRFYPPNKQSVKPCSHRSIRYTGIRYTFCSPPQTRFPYFNATSLECRLWRSINRIPYSEYRIAYTSM